MNQNEQKTGEKLQTPEEQPEFNLYAAPPPSPPPHSTKELRSQLKQSTVLVVISALTLVAATVAWFANNTRVIGGGMQISTAGPRFSLATTGTTGRYDNDTGFFTSGTQKTFENTTYFLSDNSYITWLSDTTNHIKNQAAPEDTSLGVDDLLRPGVNGQVTFYIWPQVDNLSSVTVNLSLTPYIETNESTADALTTKIYSAEKDGSLSATDTYAVPLLETDENYTEVTQLLSGHILYFKNHEKQQYSGWLKDGTLTVRPENGESYFAKDEPYSVTLYWVWPLQFDSYLTQDDKMVQLFTTDADWELFRDDINKTPKKYLAGESLDVSNMTRDMVKSDRTMRPYRVCYNEGDQRIGETVRFALLRLTAQEG